MQESITAAMSVVRRRHAAWVLPKTFTKRTISTFTCPKALLPAMVRQPVLAIVTAMVSVADRHPGACRCGDTGEITCAARCR